MNKENYEGLRKQLDGGSLDIPSQITILEIAYSLQQQIKSYKEKEEKLRELIKSKYTQPDGIENFMVESEMDYILQILNEGGDVDVKT